MPKFGFLERYQRLDRGFAKAESAVAVAVLLAMVCVASAQALFFNIAERNVAWAQALLDGLSWADQFLQKGTLWLAFLGASLATQQNKHIAIDLVPKLAPPRISAGLRAFAAFGSALIAFVLAWVFLQACLVADAAIPFEYVVLANEGPVHVCDAGQAVLKEVARPDVFCALRGLLAELNVPVSSPGGIAQLIAPVMFFVIGVRLLARALIIGFMLVFGSKGVPVESSEIAVDSKQGPPSSRSE